MLAPMLDGAKAGLLGLPHAVTAGLFDLDGVLTNTAATHDKAWQEMFDASCGEHGADIVVSDLAELLDQSNGKAAR
jgi:hypothetical protein